MPRSEVLRTMSDVTNAISEQSLRDYDRLREDCGLLHLPGLALVAMTGEDRKGWLQGQATHNVRRLESGNSVSFCFVTPTGQLLSVLDAWALPDRIVMTCPVQTLPDVLARIEHMVVMEDVEAEDAGQDFSLLSIQGPTASRRLGELIQLPSLDAGISSLEGESVYILRSDRTGLGGWDLWVPAHSAAAIKSIQDNFELIGSEAYGIARLEAGVPLFGWDMTNKTLPPEMGAAFTAKHVSYNKGCYVGQEVLMRIHSRGHTNKTWVGLVAEGALEVGATVRHPVRAEAGTVTSCAFSPDYGHIGAAILRNEVASDGETVLVKTSRGEVEAEVRSMPILRLE